MSYTLRGRIESRLAAALAAAARRAACSRRRCRRWWPLELAALMVGVGVALDVVVYHRLLATSRAGWRCRSALLELGVLSWRSSARSGSRRRSRRRSRSSPARWLARAGARPRRLPARCGSRMPRTAASSAALGVVAAAVAVVAFAGAAGGYAWSQLPAGRAPLRRRAPGAARDRPARDARRRPRRRRPRRHRRPRERRHGPQRHRRRRRERDRGRRRATTSCSTASASSARRSTASTSARGQVTIRDCTVDSLRGRYAQGIDISFSSDKGKSIVKGCTVVGGQEGIVTDSAIATVMGNRVSRTTLPGDRDDRDVDGDDRGAPGSSPSTSRSS